MADNLLEPQFEEVIDPNTLPVVEPAAGQKIPISAEGALDVKSLMNPTVAQTLEDDPTKVVSAALLKSEVTRMNESIALQKDSVDNAKKLALSEITTAEQGVEQAINEGISNINKTFADSKIEPPMFSEASIALIQTMVPKGETPVASGVGNGTQIANKTAANGTILTTLANRERVEGTQSGLGYIYHEPNKELHGGVNVFTQDMVTAEKTVHDVRYDYELNGETLVLPKGVALKFDGGSFSNGAINLNGATISNPFNAPIFSNVDFVGYANIEYITPSWFGAVGDGVTDDTEALRKAFWFSHDTKVPLLIDAGIYLVSGAMNYRNGGYADMSVNLRGRAPSMLGEYAVTRYGGIKLATDTHLFEGAKIKGSIHNISITGRREENIHIFSNCQVGRIIIRDSNFSNIGAMFYDSSLDYVSQIVDCSFQTCFWFARVVETDVSCTDSVIKGCYINGGEEPTNNSCFEWGYFNGSTVANNFIDYYRCIYHPKSNVTQAFHGGVSVGNQYQVFRYLIYPFESNFNSYSFNSSADCFNWVDPASLAKLQTYEPLSDRSGIELPPYICIAQETITIIMNDVIIQANVGGYGLYIQDQISGYEIGRCVFKTNRNIPVRLREDKGANPNVFYNNGQYNLTNSLDTNCYVEVSELPFGALGWSAIPLGHKVKFQGELYEFLALTTDAGTKVVEWRKVNGSASQIKGGTTAQRPTSPAAYSEYFDTTLSKPIYWTGSKWVDSQGVDV